jgi:Methyltransferase FkbM domain
VTVDTLDRVANELKLDRIDFVKIDVEGAEASVVAGAGSVLAKMRPVMLLEINDGALRAQGIGAEDLLQMLRKGHDYEILVFSQATGLLEAFVEGGTLSANIIAAPRERLSELVADH